MNNRTWNKFVSSSILTSNRIIHWLGCWYHDNRGTRCVHHRLLNLLILRGCLKHKEEIQKFYIHVTVETIYSSDICQHVIGGGGRALIWLRGLSQSGKKSTPLMQASRRPSSTGQICTKLWTDPWNDDDLTRMWLTLNFLKKFTSDPPFWKPIDNHAYVMNQLRQKISWLDQLKILWIWGRIQSWFFYNISCKGVGLSVLSLTLFPLVKKN